MEVTSCRIKLMPGNRADKLMAFVAIVLDDMFVVRDLRIIAGKSGRFVSMPSRKVADRCGLCSSKNPLCARFCSRCGARLDEDRAFRGAREQPKLHEDTAHPITHECRAMIERAVFAAYDAEAELARMPGYVSRWDDWEHEPDPADIAEAAERARDRQAMAV